MKQIKMNDLTTEDKKKLSPYLPFKIYLGADPEFFIASPRGKILNSDMFFPHKDSPKVINLEMPQFAKGKLYFDGIQAEFGFSPAICRVYIIMAIKKIFKAAKEIINRNKIVLKPSVKVSKEILSVAHPDARIFGCMPDYNAYTLTVNTPEMNAERHPYRYAGGHIHLGLIYNKNETLRYKRQKTILQDEREHLDWVKSLDFFVNLLTLPLDNSPAARRRRSKYGKAGCFRPTPYGVEYRSLSCWWLKSPIYTSLVFGLARLATAYVYRKGAYKRLLKALDITEEDVQNAINESDVVFAKEVWKSVRGLLCQVGSVTYNFIRSCKYGTKDMRSTIQPVTLLDYLLLENPEELLDNKVENAWQLFNEASYGYRWGNNNSFYVGFSTKLNQILTKNDIVEYQISLYSAV